MGGSMTGAVGEHVRTAVKNAGRRYLHDAHLTTGILKSIYLENNGPLMMCGQRPRDLQTRDQKVQVSQIRYSHNRISAVFGSGPHSGLPLVSLVDDLRHGIISPD